jgi:adenylylsulfate kinase
MTAGPVVWFTGLPASGKTTLARRVQDRLAPRTRCVLLDSDELHDVLGAHAYAEDDRDAFYRALGKLAVLLAGQGHVVLVAATAAKRAYRDQARAETARFFEVHVRASLPDCEARDIKGLYARARAGDAPTLPGVGVRYEAPVAPEVTAEGGLDGDAELAIAHLITEALADDAAR